MSVRTRGAVVCAIVGAVSLGGCMTDPKNTSTIMQPRTPVAKTLTNLNQAKSCMDQLFLDGARRGIPITSEKIEDATGTVKVSTVDMTINAISDMSKRSEAFSYFHIEAQGSQIGNIQNALVPLKSNPSQIPPVYIRGSVSQADNSIVRDNVSGSFTVPFASIGGGKDQSFDTISIDLQLVDVATRTVKTGITTSNTITVVSESESESARGLIQNGAFGAALSVSLASSKREGRGQAVRTLLEYSLIELLGKYTHVPYHRCLELPSADPASMQSAQAYYDGLSAEARTRAVQTALNSTREYAGPVDGVMREALQQAVSAAKLKRGLNADGRIDFQLFNALYNENVLPNEIVNAKPANPAEAPPVSAPTPASGRDPFGLTLTLTQPVSALGDVVSVRASVDAPARLYCYYEFHEQGGIRVTRIFPNQFQRDNHLVPGRNVLIPGQNSFQIVLNDTAPESIACVATTIDYRGANALPFLKEPDLTPISTPPDFSGLPYVIYKHQQVDSVQTTVKKITFQANG